jgi:hypothetical protein
MTIYQIILSYRINLEESIRKNIPKETKTETPGT